MVKVSPRKKMKSARSSKREGALGLDALLSLRLPLRVGPAVAFITAINCSGIGPSRTVFLRLHVIPVVVKNNWSNFLVVNWAYIDTYGPIWQARARFSLLKPALGLPWPQLTWNSPHLLIFGARATYLFSYSLAPLIAFGVFKSQNVDLWPATASVLCLHSFVSEFDVLSLAARLVYALRLFPFAKCTSRLATALCFTCAAVPRHFAKPNSTQIKMQHFLTYCEPTFS